MIMITINHLVVARNGSLMKTQTRILDNRLYYTRKIELHRKGKKSRTVRITTILICLLAAKSLVLITVRGDHYGKMGKPPTTHLKMKRIMATDNLQNVYLLLDK